jgi:hypothetical protein
MAKTSESETKATAAVRARRLCEGLLDGSVELLAGLRELCRLHHQPGGDEVVPDVFLGLHSDTDRFPGPAQYALWEPEALREHLAELEQYRPRILSAAREFLGRG